MSGAREELVLARRRLQDWVARRDHAGTDPYDGLASRLLPAGQPLGKWGRIAWTQFFKWCPLDLRPLALVPPLHNAKGLGLFLQGHLELARSGEAAHLEQARLLAGRLESQASRTSHGIGWGYPFPWQSRAFFLPAGTPTVVNTAFVAHALLDLAELDPDGSARWRELARAAGRFVARDLPRTKAEAGECLAYTPLDRTCIHNANLLGAGLLIRLAALDGDEALAGLARRCCAFSLAAQRSDGSWFYADTSFQGWIDSYHTIFNLMALGRFQAAGEGAQVDEAKAQGEEFFLRHLLDGGHVLYRTGQPWPVDVHGPAAAILYLAGAPELRPRAWEVWFWTRKHLLRKDGSFAFLEDPRWWRRNRTPHMRWCQAWMWAALCKLENSTCEEGG